jgi:hypothetical protein
VCGGRAFFLLDVKRGIERAKALLGNFRGVLITDRWRGYNRTPAGGNTVRAHVKRGFTRISEMPGEVGAIAASFRTRRPGYPVSGIGSGP